MKTKTFCMSAMMLAVVAAIAAPEIREGSVTLVQDADRTVRIGYILDNAPAVVTVSILTNGVPLSGELLAGRLTGALNRRVENRETPYEIVWRPVEDERIAGDRNWALEARAVVTAWPLSSPPTWMVVDLTVRDTVEFYPDESWFPLPVTNDLYKTDRLVLRKIPAAGIIYRLGSSDTLSTSAYNEPGRRSDGNTPNEPAREVMLTQDYYIGIYEFTQGQYNHIKTNPKAQTKTGDTYPAGNQRWMQELRGQCPAYFWPTAGHSVDPNLFLGKLRAHLSGVFEFDLPTEAQWEIACRAGECAAFNSGLNDYADTAALARIAWTKGTSGGEPHPVGMLAPNRWGLYDMHGNLVEWCLDLNPSPTPTIADAEAKAAHIAYAAATGLLVDPVGPEVASDERTDGAERSIAKGGGYTLDDDYARSARRYNPNRWGSSDLNGFRVVCPAEFKQGEAR